MNVGDGWEQVRRVLRTVRPYVPVSVLVIAAVSGALVLAGLEYRDLFAGSPLNPLYYVTNMVFHDGWEHYTNNMRLLVPFGVILTWYTSDRHVLGLALTAHILANIIAAASGQIGAGASSMALAVVAATLVRATGHALEGAPTETLQTAITGVFGPLVVGFLLIVVVVGGAGDIAHVHHFFGFLYGGAIEAMYVLGASESGDSGRDIPKGIGR